MRTFVFAALVLGSLTGPTLAKPRPAKPEPQIVPERQRQCKATTESGLGYRALRTGNGEPVGKQRSVVVNYIGYFRKTGTVFDQNQGANFSTNAIIPGLREGLRLMPLGSIYRFCIPSRLAYGAQDAGPIPAGSDLVFQLELLAIP